MGEDLVEFKAPFGHALAVIRPALLLASGFLDELRTRLQDEGIRDAVTGHDSGFIFDWVMPLLGLQGISDAVAFGFSAQHGNLRFEDIDGGLLQQPACPQLRSFWHFHHCGFRKALMICAEPQHLPDCLLPAVPLRKGLLNEAGYAFYFFVRDICDGDFVSWIDRRLAAADPGFGVDGRETQMRDALLDPLANVVGTGRKLWSMILAELLLAGDLDRERWIATGGSMIAIDSLVHVTGRFPLVPLGSTRGHNA